MNATATARTYTANDVIEELTNRCRNLVIEVNGPEIEDDAKRLYTLTLRTFEAALPAFLDSFERHNGKEKADALRAELLEEEETA